MTSERKLPALQLPADQEERIRYQAGKAGVSAHLLLSVALERGLRWAETDYVPTVARERARCLKAAARRRARPAARPATPRRRARRGSAG